MEKLLLAIVVLLSSLCFSFAGQRRYGIDYSGGLENPKYERVDGYNRKDGTYVEPYYRTKANDTIEDNYSTRGNQNPWTSKRGTVESPSVFDRYNKIEY